MLTVRINISGKVQGVFFRASSKKEAEKRNLTGWVKNTKDDKVEALVSGDADQIREFIDWCHQGPAGAIVNEVQVEEEHYKRFDGFKIMRD